MERIDARGQACPLPVVRAKKALAAMGEGALEVLVDNETAVHNLQALAKTLKCSSAVEKRADAEFAVTIAKAAGAGDEADAQEAACACAAPSGEVTNMYVIVERQMAARVVVRP